MNGPSLQRLTLLSLVIHLTFFVVASVTIKKTSHFVMPSPYIVSLVGSEKQNASVASVKSQLENEKDTVAAQKNSARQDTREDKYLSEVMSALEAKKKVEKIVRMRNIISLKKNNGGKANAVPGTSGKKGDAVADDYSALIRKEIWDNWSFPDTGDKNLEAVVSIKILKDGTIHIEGFEKKSGNSLFDRSVIRAITKVDKLTPPPFEMEIGVRFYP